MQPTQAPHVQNGTCKKEHTVSGANTSLLSSLVLELTPNSPDADEPEVRLFCLLETQCALYWFLFSNASE